MTPAEYLEAAKAALNLPSDYAIAKAMGIDGGRLLKLKRGTRPMDEAEAIWIATTIQADPAQVMADLAEQREKNPKKKDFLKGFMKRAAALAAICCTLGLISFDGAGSAQAATGGRRRLRYA